jgi:hypothetical protein
MRPCIRIYYFNVSYCSTCFERYIAHQQKLKNYICSLWFTYVCVCQPATTDPHGGHGPECEGDMVRVRVGHGMAVVILLCYRWLSTFLKFV